MDKLTLSPDQSGYGFQYPVGEVIRTFESTGVGYYGRGIWNGAIRVRVTWQGLNGDQCTTLFDAYQTHISEGGAPFPMDLIIENADVREYQVRFIADSYSLSSWSQDAFTVTAEMEVEPLPLNPATDTWPADILIT